MLIPELVELPSELTETHYNMTVPAQGDNSVLLEWCLNSASNNRKLNLQMESIKELQNRE
jgi:hypothetical protein